MSVQPPKIDKRTYPEIVAQTEQLAQQFTQWRPKPDGKPDAGRALIRIFGRMATAVSDRLNKVPDKNFLAFLDAIGTQILPPFPARVPLTFTLVPNSSADAFVPAGTQVAAPPIEGEEREVVFETERDLALIGAQLQAALVREPGADKYSDRTLEVTGNLDAPFSAFQGHIPIEHSLYLACDELFAAPESKTVILSFYFPLASGMETLPLIWSYWDGTSWKSLNPSSQNHVYDNLWEIAFDNLKAPGRTTVNGKEAAWLRATFNERILPNEPLPSLDSISARVRIEKNNLIAPDICFFNAASIDLSKDFYPFGTQPRFNDTFYLGSREVFAKPRATVTIEVKLSDLAVNKNGGAELVWETYNGSSWEMVGSSSVSSPRTSGQAEFSDRTQALTQSGQITFTLPFQPSPATIGGETNYWLRARLIKGNYGTEATYRQSTNLTTTSVQPVPATFAPPSVQSIGLKYTYQSRDLPLTFLQSYNDFTYIDRSGERRDDYSLFQPFTSTADNRPTLYLGFDRAFPNRTISLYVQVEPPLPGEIAKANSITIPARIVWEYSSAAGWVALEVQDETEAFSQRGAIRFIAPQDFSSRSEFSQSLYWLRARWESGQFLVPPRLRRLLTNTVWASQAMTIAEEILGSSDGNPHQIYRISQVPVLLGERLQVLEAGEPSAEEIERLEGAGAIAIVRNERGEVEGVWVTWQEMPDFYGSDKGDRHYVLDRVKGEVRFGDGINGKIPPQGRNNIRLAPYRTGGGERGNRPASTIAELRTTVPYVASVTNLEAATGGDDRESLERVKDRGPKALRHRNRAVTVEDIEDLAREASAEVARALAIAPVFNPIDGLDWLPIYRINLDASGELKVELIAPPDYLTLEVNLNGPGQSIPYASKQLTKSNPAMTYTVTTEQFKAGREWNVTFTNLGATSADNVKAKITYPTGSVDADFQAPGMMSELSSNPYRAVKNAGKIELIIVPNSPERQPTPSLSLLERVKDYIRDRSAPTITLQVTEPDWVEVTLRARIVPLSLDNADEVKRASVNAVVTFLHPITGGTNGQGWDFGRRPHLSDLYSILEKVEGVDYVDFLSIESPSLDQLSADRLDRFLIYSGAHEIQLISPPKGA